MLQPIPVRGSSCVLLVQSTYGHDGFGKFAACTIKCASLREEGTKEKGVQLYFLFTGKCCSLLGGSISVQFVSNGLQVVCFRADIFLGLKAEFQQRQS